MRKIMLVLKLLLAYVAVTAVQYIRTEDLEKYMDSNKSLIVNIIILLSVGLIMGWLIRETKSNQEWKNDVIIILTTCLLAFGIPLLYWSYMIFLPDGCLKASNYFIIFMGIYIVNMIPHKKMK